MATMPDTTAPSTERARRFELSRWSGVLFVVIGVPGFVLGNPTSPYLTSADEYVAKYADGFLWASLVSAAVLVWAITLAAKRAGALPGWLCWVGFVLTPLFPIGWMLFMAPALVFYLWFAAVVAIVPVRRAAGAS